MTSIASGHYVHRTFTGVFAPSVRQTAAFADWPITEAQTASDQSTSTTAGPSAAPVIPPPLSTQSAPTLLAAQEAASKDPDTADKDAGGYQPSDIEQQFFDYMEMTPAERIRAAILKELGITEEELAAKPPRERQALEDEIAQRIQDNAVKNAQDRERRDA